jgi:hypothetical protein
MCPRKVASVLMRAPVMRRSFEKMSAIAEGNARLARLFMICSNIKLIGVSESTGIGI